MHSSWKHWWKATSRTPCPTALYILVCSCSATRSWLDMWLRSVSCWTSWSQSSSTWWRVALLKVSFRVSCPSVLDHSDWTLQVSMKQVADVISFWITTTHPMWIAWDFLISFIWSNWWFCRLITNIFRSMHDETDIQFYRFSWDVVTQFVEL